jgi:hypothetical protein
MPFKDPQNGAVLVNVGFLIARAQWPNPDMIAPEMLEGILSLSSFLRKSCIASCQEEVPLLEQHMKTCVNVSDDEQKGQLRAVP